MGFIIIAFGVTIVNQVLSIIRTVSTEENATKLIEKSVKFANSIPTEPTKP